VQKKRMEGMNEAHPVSLLIAIKNTEITLTEAHA
jgi:hypothetical protein